MKFFMQLLRRPIALKSVPRTVGSIVCSIAGLSLLFATIRSLPKLQLTETQLFFAMLLTVGVMVQMTVAGMVFDIHRWLERTGKTRDV